MNDNHKYEITIGVPTKNRAHVIERAIKSLLAQKNVKVEVLVVDNASSDNTQEICKKYIQFENFRYVRNSFDIGPVANYNKCLELANGEFFMILSDDDWISDNYAELAVNKLKEGENLIFYGSCIKIDAEGRTTGESCEYFSSIKGKDFLKLFLTGDPRLRRHAWFMLCTSTRLLRECGGFVNTTCAQHSDNLLLLLLVSINVDIVFNKEAIFYYSVYPSSYGNRDVPSVAAATADALYFFNQSIKNKLQTKCSPREHRIYTLYFKAFLFSTYMGRIKNNLPNGSVLLRLKIFFLFPYKFWLFHYFASRLIRKFRKIFHWNDSTGCY